MTNLNVMLFNNLNFARIGEARIYIVVIVVSLGSQELFKATPNQTVLPKAINLFSFENKITVIFTYCKNFSVPFYCSMLIYFHIKRF